jgi:hypothetical protein
VPGEESSITTVAVTPWSPGTAGCWNLIVLRPARRLGLDVLSQSAFARLLVVELYHARVDQAVPPEGRERQDGTFHGFFFKSVESGSAEEAAQLAELRARFGDEVVDRFQRHRELWRHSRPLTASDREVIRGAMAPVLMDLEASDATVPEFEYETWGDDSRDGREGVSAKIRVGGSIWIPTEECSKAEQVWWVADQLQEWVIGTQWRAGRSSTWPECPEHPASHPLKPDVDENAAVWRCPGSQRVICLIGALGSQG